MGLSYSYEDDMLRIVGEGDYTAQDLMDLLAAALSDPRSRPGISTLMDVRRSEAARTTDELVSIVDFLGSTTDLRFGLSRMVSVYLEKYGVDLRVFRDIESAELWLRSG